MREGKKKTAQVDANVEKVGALVWSVGERLAGGAVWVGRVWPGCFDSLQEGSRKTKEEGERRYPKIKRPTVQQQPPQRWTKTITKTIAHNGGCSLLHRGTAR